MKLPLFLGAAALLCISTTARAYPTAVGFTPTGEVTPFANIDILGFSQTNLSPHITPGPTWLGIEAGLLPRWDYGSSGLSFGGLEVGFDTIQPFGADNTVKPVFNFKLGLVTEGTCTPMVAVGLMELSPAMSSMNFAFVSMTKTLRADKDSFSYGRVTLGYGLNTGSTTQFMGTAPFKSDQRSALMGSYEFPYIAKKLGFWVDYLGGTSEISDSYFGANFLVNDATVLAAGMYLANDRSVAANTWDGFFAYLQVTFDVRTVFASADPPPPPPAQAPVEPVH